MVNGGWSLLTSCRYYHAALSFTGEFSWWVANGRLCFTSSGIVFGKGSVTVECRAENILFHKANPQSLKQLLQEGLGMLRLAKATGTRAKLRRGTSVWIHRAELDRFLLRLPQAQGTETQVMVTGKVTVPPTQSRRSFEVFSLGSWDIP